MNLCISMIGPSGSGKSSLIASHLIQTQNVLNACENPDGVHIFPSENDEDVNGKTSKDKIDIAKQSFITAIQNSEATTFSALLNGDNAKTTYRLEFVFNKKYTGPDLNIEITDYPGGWLGGRNFLQVQDFMTNSTVILIPIPADILLYMEQHKADGQIFGACYSRLKVHDVMDCVQAWIAHRVRNHLKGLLLFVPIRCEHCFGDNCYEDKEEKKGKKLLELVDSYYIDRLVIDDEVRKYITCKIQAVDTYGISKYTKTVKENGRYISEFSISLPPGRGRTIRPKGAYDQLSTIIAYYLDIIREMEEIMRENLQQQKNALGILGTFWNYCQGNPLGKSITKHQNNIDVLKNVMISLMKNALSVSKSDGKYSIYREKDIVL